MRGRLSPLSLPVGQEIPCVATKQDRRITIAKDLILFLGGLAGIAYQQITNNVNIVLLIVFTAMTGVLGLTNILSLLRNSPTVSPSSSPQRPSSVPESANASQESFTGEEIT